ncbi:MAG: SirB1 family protein [Elainellaceae cyanobacterium]
MEFSPARQRFTLEVRQPEEQINLAATALYIAQEEYPDLDVEEYLNALDTMALEIQERLPAEFYPLKVIRGINQYLYEDLGFAGNTANYYDPDNSYLNCVIDRRLGIPITLSLVYLEVARRVGLPMVGVNMPGHFLIRPDLPEMEIFVDPFHQGEVLFMQDCQDRLNSIYGRQVLLRPEFFKPIATKRLLSRMLTNLKFIYLNRGEMAKTLAAIERILLIFPDAPVEHRDRGLIYYQVGRWVEACDDLFVYLDQVPAAQDAGVVRQLLKRMGATP